MSDDRTLGPEMVAEGWCLIGGDDIMWMHAVPCWGTEPVDPKAAGYFVVCRVHCEGGDPLYGDAFWVESYATALKVARQIRLAILSETPADARARKREVQAIVERDEALREVQRLRNVLAPCGTSEDNPDTCGVCGKHFHECEDERYLDDNRFACPGARARAVLAGG